MPDNELFTKALNLEKPWYVMEVKFDPSEKRLDIYIGRTSELLPCPLCGKPCVDYDSTDREWRHLDFFQYEAHIHARIPRTSCKEHGIKTVNIPKTAFKRSYGFKAIEYRDTMIFLVAGKLKLPTLLQR